MFGGKEGKRPAAAARTAKPRRPGELKPAKYPADPQRALSYCFWLLGRRDYARAELEKRLVRKGYEPAAVSACLARLADYGYVDDARFAERFARSAVAGGRAYGVRLAMELARKGIDRELAAEAVAASEAQTDLDREIERLIDRRHGAGPIVDRKERDRLAAALARKGLPLRRIFAALDRFGRDAD